MGYCSWNEDVITDSRIAGRPRMEIAAQAVRHLTEDVVTLNLFHGTTPTVVGPRLTNVGPGGERAEQTWNATIYDLT